ncbi:tastin isoform X2 [Pseudophryne corroboree]|uniref:tastin isoform X2 n=1 Tax=Pseudophryne corroboree TaxID=495146 RepID=UPI00308163B8
MLPVSQALTGVSHKKPLDFHKNSWVKGKENCLSSPPCPQQGKQKPTLQKIVLKDPQKSKLPIPLKTRAPPDFQKMHQAWQNHFQRGKAVSKKSCTRPQPFNFTQKGDRHKVPASTDAGLSVNPPASHRVREPLAEVVLGLKNLNCKDANVKDTSEVEFKADPAALFSILSNVGVPAAAGKLSLAQRVPMRVSATAQQFSSRNMMVRSSMYSMRSCQTTSSNSDRMSYFSKMHTKVNDEKPLCRPNDLFKSHIPVVHSKGPAAFKKDDKLQSQENQLLQQMNSPPHVLVRSITSPPLAKLEVNTAKSAILPLVMESVAGTASSSAVKCEQLEVNASAENCDLVRTPEDQQKSDAGSGEFVADLQALTSILTNTGVSTGNCGKLSLAQRVPVPGTNAVLKGGMTCSGSSAKQATTPTLSYGRMSNIALPLKVCLLSDLVFSPYRVPKASQASDPSPGGSARRVHKLQYSTMKFSQFRSGIAKQPFFPKTPRALALENANKRLDAERSDTQNSAKSTVKWVDELSPSPVPGVVGEKEPDMEQVAVRLFLDGESPGQGDKKKELNESSDPLKMFDNSPANLQQQQQQMVLSETTVTPADGAGYSQDFPLHKNQHLAPLSHLNTSDTPQPPSNSVSFVKTSLPLSFLSHPAVKALQSNTLGPHSLPTIARLRLEATMSSKQRFWDTYLDEECAFYTSRGTANSCRRCNDPVSSLLEQQDDMHFTPINPGDS